MRKSASPAHSICGAGGCWPKNRFLNVYIHNFLRSDEERALHNHPWLWNISLIIRGSYIEHMPGGESKLRKSFRPVFRLGHTPHRVQLLPASDGKSGVRAVWTLFIIGPKVRDWGFFCPKGWVHNEEFNTPTEHGTKVGRGCD